MTRGQKHKLRKLKEVHNRRKVFGGNGYISMPHINTDNFDIVIYKNSIKRLEEKQ